MIDSSKLDDPRWYVLHTFTGYEQMAVDNLNKCIAKNNLQEYILEVKVPMETVIEEDKNGKKKAVERKLFPCYILIKMRYTDSLWHTIVNSRGVTGFVGHGSEPIPLTDEEVARMGIEKVYIDLDVEVGETVRVISGPFESFMGVVEEINKEKQVLRVKVSMFGRETPVELEFSQVDKLS
jgi:transcriptional antiterminator NusG